jgi:hypothetical protein
VRGSFATSQQEPRRRAVWCGDMDILLVRMIAMVVSASCGDRSQWGSSLRAKALTRFSLVEWRRRLRASLPLLRVLLWSGNPTAWSQGENLIQLLNERRRRMSVSQPPSKRRLERHRSIYRLGWPAACNCSTGGDVFVAGSWGLPTSSHDVCSLVGVRGSPLGC